MIIVMSSCGFCDSHAGLTHYFSFAALSSLGLAFNMRHNASLDYSPNQRHTHEAKQAAVTASTSQPAPAPPADVDNSQNASAVNLRLLLFFRGSMRVASGLFLIQFQIPVTWNSLASLHSSRQPPVASSASSASADFFTRSSFSVHER